MTKLVFGVFRNACLGCGSSVLRGPFRRAEKWGEASMQIEATTPVTRLSEYKPSAWLVTDVHLTFALNPVATRITSRLTIVPNPGRADDFPHDLKLDGRKLKLLGASINGEAFSHTNMAIDDEQLSIDASFVPQAGFVWECVVEVNPTANTALEGLYMSNGMYCTQCEAQGFRKITWYPDRPDVMARFTVRIEGSLPVMLSNGNLMASGTGFATWQDPWPKPAYLFALVAGDLVSHDDTFTTVSGRKVDLKIYVRSGDIDKCAYAMDALKRSMLWDEQEYGREYDLDLFMIVAVDDFNMGAMENKGLNIFNSKYVLASPETATDRDYELIEGIIAHEYFHNWTGNRITCRDWFQLCLKEGLTVYRDQQFSGDQRSHAVKRIADVQLLRSRQFREDAGPLAHPVRPESYIEINNFYTATVYEKGAEVIGMLRHLVGDALYRKALDLYFTRHDGQACTIEDWLKVFADATGRDLTQFKLWYSQAGTPKVRVSEDYRSGIYTLTLQQSVPATPGQTEKQPMLIPVSYGFVGPTGTMMGTPGMLELSKETQSYEFNLPSKPVLSILRGFSAPVTLDYKVDSKSRAFLLAHDTDPFNKWDAARQFGLALLSDLSRDNNLAPDADFLQAMNSVLCDETMDPAFRALTLTLPSEEEIAQYVAGEGRVPDPGKIYDARNVLNTALANHMRADLEQTYATMTSDGAYSPDAQYAGRRSLQNVALALLTCIDDQAALARQQFAHADNMNQSLAALSVLVAGGRGGTELNSFYEKWRHDRLVIDKWFSVQAALTPPEFAASTVSALTRHPDFEWRNPNRFRSLMGSFAVSNQAGFHAADGSGYALFADWLITLDGLNPQTTARLCGAFESWKRYDDNRRTLMELNMKRIAEKPGLSKDSGDIINRILEA